MNGLISDSGGLVWATVEPAQCPVKTDAVIIKTAAPTIRQNSLILI
jgi:hypothetical protein